MNTKFAMIIRSGFHVYINYYDNWDLAQSGFIKFIEDIQQFQATEIREVLLCNDSEIKLAWYNKKITNN